MKNAVGREIPDEILARTGKEVFKGSFHNDQKVYRRAANQSRAHIVPTRSKVLSSIKDALIAGGVHDGMTFGFHHHFREGDYIVNLVMEAVHEIGIKDVTIEQ